MAKRRPMLDEDALMSASDDVWKGLTATDWLEAFGTHPRIGASKAPDGLAAQSADWSTDEQKQVAGAGEAVKAALAAGNREYEHKFGQIFIVCATGKSPKEILAILQRRLDNDGSTELREAAEQQRQITRIRLRKWLQA